MPALSQLHQAPVAYQRFQEPKVAVTLRGQGPYRVVVIYYPGGHYAVHGESTGVDFGQHLLVRQEAVADGYVKGRRRGRSLGRFVAIYKQEYNQVYKKTGRGDLLFTDHTLPSKKVKTNRRYSLYVPICSKLVRGEVSKRWG